jgi:transketolase N-terminal domain/subunit
MGSKEDTMRTNPLLYSVLLACCALPLTLAAADTATDCGTAERGRYLMIAGGCNDCHTPGYMQTEGQAPEEQWLTGSAVGFQGPWGTTYPCNLRLYAEQLTEAQLVEFQGGGARGTCTSVGQEACAVGVVEAMEWRDRILTNHHSAGHLIARGADLGRTMAEVLGRVDGYCGGHSGRLHIASRELGVVLTSTIVGGDLSMAPGLALAPKMWQGEPDGIVAVFFGNGAACEGIFHESLNLAVQRQLPLLFVSENNQWQAFVHRLETMPDRAIADWARSHGLPTRSVDGNAVDEVHAPARLAKRSGTELSAWPTRCAGRAV